MIRRLTLTNWRAYESVELDLEPGTTFVVARNGIGKSSLIEGATWALFGDAGGRPSDHAPRTRAARRRRVHAEPPRPSMPLLRHRRAPRRAYRAEEPTEAHRP